jgi:hypothetical protein
MKQFSLFTTLLIIAIVGLAISLMLSRVQSAKISADFEKFKEGSVSNKRFEDALLDQEAGMSFILRLLDDRESNMEALNFIATIDGGMRFSSDDLPLFDDLAVYRFYECYRTFARGVRSDYEAKSICFLVDRETESIVDVLLVNGELKGVVWANLRDTEYEQYFEISDDAGNETQYVVRRDGFHKLDEQTIWEQDIVHAAEWVAILEEKPSPHFDINEARKTLKELKDGVLKKLPD